MRGVLEDAVSLAVTNRIARGILANRQRGGSPKFIGIFVANVDRLTRLVTDRVVRPRGDLILAAIDRPGIARPFGRDLEAERGIGDHVDPWRRGPLPLAENRHIFTAVSGKPTEAIEKFHCRSGGGGLRLTNRRRAVRRRGGRLDYIQAF